MSRIKSQNHKNKLAKTVIKSAQVVQFLLDTFRMFDQDKDGYINKDELTVSSTLFLSLSPFSKPSENPKTGLRGAWVIKKRYVFQFLALTSGRVWLLCLICDRSYICFSCDCCIFEEVSRSTYFSIASRRDGKIAMICTVKPQNSGFQNSGLSRLSVTSKLTKNFLKS